MEKKKFCLCGTLIKEVVAITEDIDAEAVYNGNRTPFNLNLYFGGDSSAKNSLKNCLIINLAPDGCTPTSIELVEAGKTKVIWENKFIDKEGGLLLF